MTPADRADWVEAEGTVPPIVTADLWAAAQPIPARSGSGGPRPDRPGPNRYALRGLLACGQCGRLMQGNTLVRKTGRYVAMYRCQYRIDYPGDAAHPPSLSVAEHRVLPVVDDWLTAIFDPERADETIAALLAADGHHQPEPDVVTSAQKAAVEAESRLRKYLDALDAGMDPTLVAERTKAAQADLARAKAIIARHRISCSRPLRSADIRIVLDRYSSLAHMLQTVATPKDRRELYAGIGLRLAYHRASYGRDLVRAAVGVEKRFVRVGGGTWPHTTRETVFDLVA